MKWLFFSYSLPTEPSKSRVYVWRQLKKLGAVNFQTVWVVPQTAAALGEMHKLVEFVEQNKGDALLIEGKALNEKQVQALQKTFVDSRNEEYQELIEKCVDFANEVAAEIERKNFIFAEVEENEEELDKLKQWLAKIESRDFVKAPLRKVAVEKIRESEKIFDEFAKTVFEHSQKKK
ncbi:MAG: chromate resistance protein ChrB [Nitrospiraceae bacterium]|jgi:pyruvate-formate lyase-activating enzyme|nr:chromate resistance protein ChrB [Nitrospiraceae bacterium]